MPAKLRTAIFSLLLTPSLLPAAADAQDNPAVFPGLSYPIEAKLTEVSKEGSVFFETPYSEAPAAGYELVLLQGEMPDAAVSVELVVKGRSFFSAPARYSSESFRRFPNGRFWARYRVPLTRQPLKLSLVDLGVK